MLACQRTLGFVDKVACVWQSMHTLYSDALCPAIFNLICKYCRTQKRKALFSS